MKVKVCGLRNQENIQEIAQLPVDYLGFIFYYKSPRYVKDNKALPEWLKANEEALSGQKRVGVFVNAEIDLILNAVHDYQLDYVQLHGNESAAYCGELQTLWSVSSMEKAKLIKAFSIDEDFDFDQTSAYAAYCPLFVFDTKGEQAGGTGKKFAWSKLEEYAGATPFLLSGGIGPNDVKAIQQVKHPQLHGIDINSRFETEPGHKDVNLIKTFLAELKDT